MLALSSPDLNMFCFKIFKVSPEMAFCYVLYFLLAACSLAVENTQALTASQRCEEDTNTFLREINQNSPKEYAVSSKCFCLLKAFSYVHVPSDWGNNNSHLDYRIQTWASCSFRRANLL